MANNRNDQESNIPWWAVVFCLMALPPLGFILLFMSLAGTRLSFFDRSVGTYNRKTYGAGAYQPGQRQTPPAGARTQGTAYGQPGAAGQSKRPTGGRAPPPGKDRPPTEDRGPPPAWACGIHMYLPDRQPTPIRRRAAF